VDFSLKQQMNREIVIAFLREHESLCPLSSVSKLLTRKSVCSFCHHLNRDTLLLITSIKGARKSVDVGIALSSTSGMEQYKPYITAGFTIFRQKGKTERIKGIFDSAFNKGYESVIALAHSVPNIPPGYLENALKDLRNGFSLVAGPLINGGFYLIGMTESEHRHLKETGALCAIDFENSNERDLSINTMKDSCAQCNFLPEWYCIKCLEDLRRLHTDFQNGVGSRARWTNRIADEIV